MNTKILIVEDRESVGKTIELVLKVRGFDAKHVMTAGEAYLELQSASYDLMMCDLNLEEVADGLAVIEGAKKIRPDIKVILTSGSDDNMPKDQKNIDAISLKPIFPNDLTELINKLTQKAA